MIGRTLSHYRIVSAIGKGGMGEVFRATDTKLGRDVALKVLPPEMARDSDRLARFQREARAVAALNHPHIVTIFSVEEADGVHFLTMELVEGLSLDHGIPPGGMPVEQIVEISGALADALAAAHEKGIVHRDLKPGNVMVTADGRVKVLDFGLAKDVRADIAGDATLTSAQTQMGVVMGTPAYMSPEQISGRVLDHRTDIFSLGVMLHEMATGKRPFEGQSSAELQSAILRDHPASVTDTRADLPIDLARIIRRCLEKDPRYRMQTARDVSNEFRDLARQTSHHSAVTSAVSRSIAVAQSGPTRTDEGFWVAVLPFRYTGGNADLKSLADGMSEEVVTGLSRFSYLRVIARGSTAKYSSESGDVRSIGRDLGARYVMEGGIRQAGSKVRIAVQLVDANAGVSLWAETYERAFNSEAVFDLQDELVPRIVSTVADRHGVLPHSMSQAVQAKDSEQMTPYEAVMLSFSYAEHITSDEHIAAKACLERAVEQMPGYADAWAMLAVLFCDEYSLGPKQEFSLLDRALSAARRAVKAGPSNHLAYQNLAYAHFLRQEFSPCKNAADRSLALNSIDGANVWFMGLLIAYMGDWERGCALVKRAMELNPNFPGKYRYPLVANAYRKGDYRGALSEALRTNLPDVFYTPLLVAAAAGQLGEKEVAEKAVRDLLALWPRIAAVVRENLGKWFQPELTEHFIEGLAKAGLEIPGTPAVPATTSSATSPTRTTSGESRADVREDEGFWVAVLPFKYSGGNADLKAFAEGLSEEVITGLSRFSYLRVIARGSTAKYSSASGDVRAIGKELGARYVMEGNLRQVGNKLRIAVQLVDASTGSHLWAETYERTFSSEAIFELQDELVPRIVSTIADAHGILPHTLSEMVRGTLPEELTPYEAVLRSFGYMERISPKEHAAARTALERAVELSPNYAYAWAMLSMVWGDEYAQGFGGQPDPLGRALQAARKAVDLDPSNHRSFQALASAHFHRREIAAFRSAAERAIALNPIDGSALANMGGLMGSSGDWEHGCALVEQAIQLNPNHPGWYWFPLFHNAYRKKDYQGALGIALKVNLPGYFFTHVALAVAYAQLGESEAAGKAVQELFTLVPDFAKTARAGLSVWLDPDLVEHYVDGLRKAGLEFDESATRTNPSHSATSQVVTSKLNTNSGAMRADEGFWVAVLPFKYAGASAELKALADGLSEEIVTGLSRFSYLRVIARGSTLRYADQALDLRVIGRELGARYIMEGNLRQSGNKLRTSIQLVDTISGTHLWAQTYDHAFSPETIFELQDDLVPRIVSTIADEYGVLTRSLSESLRSKNEDEFTPHEAVLRTFSYFERITPEEHAIVGRILERAVQQAPEHADSLAMLSMIYRGEYAQGFNPRPNSLERALALAQRAVNAGPSNHIAYYALATTYFFQKEKQAFRVAAERSIALNPMDGSTMAFLGLLMAAAVDGERGIALVKSGMRLNPNYPGWYKMAIFSHAYHQKKYQEALDAAIEINLPGYFHAHAARTVAFAQLGELEAARKALKDLLALRPDYVNEARQEYNKWYEPAQVEHILDGLRKAGLEVP